MSKLKAGQAIVESLLILLTLAVLLHLMAKVIIPLQAQQLSRIEKARAVLWQVTAAKPRKQSDDYSFAQRTKVVLSPLKSLTGLSLPQDNLVFVESTPELAPLARIDDSWSPSKGSDLTARGAQLTPFAKLNNLGVGKLLDILSWLHFTEEFADDSLRLGHVAVDVTPTELGCRESNSC